MNDGLHWGAPQFLPLLWAIPVLFLIFWGFRMLSRRTRARLADPVTRDKMLRGYRPFLPAWRHLLWLLAMSLGLLSLARPQWGFEYVEVKRKGLDILVVIDTSNSMLATDFRPNRLEKAKFALLDFTEILKGDRIGLVAFAGSSFLQCPLTADYPAFRMTLNDLYPGIIREGGTNIGDALDTAIQKFDPGSEALRVVILITDGEDHENEMADVAAKLLEQGITLYAIGAATPEGAFIELIKNGKTTLLKNPEGNVVKSTLNEAPLQELSSITGGFYVRASPIEFGLETVYTQGIDLMQKTEGQATRIKIYRERYVWFLGLAFLLLCVESLLGHRQPWVRTS